MWKMAPPNAEELVVELGRDETAEPGPSDRDLTEDGTGRLGLACNNPYLQRVYVDYTL